MGRIVFGVVLALTVCHAAQARSVPRKPAPAARHTAAPSVADLYSLRARRRMASYIRLRLLEWREAGLERAAAVIEHRLPVDTLVPKLRATDESAKH